MGNVGSSVLSRALRFVPGSVRGLVRSIPGVASAQRAAIAVFASEEFEHEIDYGPAKGLRMPILLPRDKGFWKGTYEWEFCNRLSAAVQRGDTCFDIGAFRGYTAGVMAMAGAAKVWAFEPSPANQDAIRHVLELNPDRPIELIPAAVGAVPGKISITLHDDPSMNYVGGNPAGRPAVEVDLCSVDDVIAGRVASAPQLMKIDVEGAEGSVLQGAKKALQESVREIFIEIHHAEALAECGQLLAEAGFTKVWQSSDTGDFPVQMQFSKKRT